MNNAKQNQPDRYTPAQLLDAVIARNLADERTRRPYIKTNCDLLVGAVALILVKYCVPGHTGSLAEALRDLRLKFFTAAMDRFCELKLTGTARAGFVTDMCALVLAEHINANTFTCHLCDGRGYLLGVHCRACDGTGGRPLMDHHRADFLKLPVETYIGAWKPFYQDLQELAREWERSALVESKKI